jgi:mRNA interferase MazF
VAKVFPGDVVVAPLAQADGGLKPRPVLLLRELPGFGDYLACGISTQLHQAIEGFDLILSPGSSEFSAAGLRTESVVRLGFVGVVPVMKMTRRLGRLPPHLLALLQTRLADHIHPVR